MTTPPAGSRRKLARAAAPFILIFSLVVVGVGGFFGGRNYEQYVYGVPPAGLKNSATPEEINGDFSLFWKAWNAVSSKYYGEANAGKRIEGAISGMVSSLDDPYTVYLEPSSNTLFQSDLEGSFGGIGAELNVKDGMLTVVSALSGTPAEKNGLRSGDIILEIDGTKTEGMNFNDAINKVRGEKGTQVVLTVGRSGSEEHLKITLTRDTIVVKSVVTESIGEGGSIAYIKVNEFGQDTADAFKVALEEAKASGKKGVIVDLRNNPGGYLDAAVRMVGMVIPESVDSDKQVLSDRTAVLERSKDGKEHADTSSESPVWDDGKLVVLVNGGSASASEIFAGAVRDYGRAKLVGNKTFGKGSVQELQDLSNGGSIKVTVAKWFTPLGVGIDGKGLEPDEAVMLPNDAIPSSSDAQVSKALELLK